MKLVKKNSESLPFKVWFTKGYRCIVVYSKNMRIKSLYRKLEPYDSNLEQSYKTIIFDDQPPFISKQLNFYVF